MAQFTVYRNANPQTKATFPLLLDVQSDLLVDLPTRAVIPLTQSAALTKNPLNRLTPFIDLDGKSYLLLTYQLASVPKSILGAAVSDASEHRDAIINALDFLITGI
ncbi:MAG TPA: CcdB family protein [Gammaproteobacteria bacterium]|nr:CcdB family protein [Gammaproteobacteria bacterium]